MQITEILKDPKTDGKYNIPFLLENGRVNFINGIFWMNYLQDDDLFELEYSVVAKNYPLIRTQVHQLYRINKIKEIL